MKQQLIIIGARPFGRETCNYAREAGFAVKGFLDDKSDALDGFSGYPRIIGSAESYMPVDGDVFVCAVGDSKFREKYVKMMLDKGVEFVNIVHPSAYIGPNVKMGVGCVIGPMAMVDCDLTLGNHVDVNSQSYVPHDCVLEDYVTISPGCKLGGGTVLRHGAFMGIGAVTLPRVELGEYAYIGAGSVVTKYIQPSVIAVGAPAVIKREL